MTKCKYKGELRNYHKTHQLIKDKDASFSFTS